MAEVVGVMDWRSSYMLNIILMICLTVDDLFNGKYAIKSFEGDVFMDIFLYFLKKSELGYIMGIYSWHLLASSQTIA